MANLRLRKALSAARLSVESVAEEIQVDPKTIQRWLDGRIPHTRNRWALAALLQEDEDYLWPPPERTSGGSTSTDEIVDAYAHRALAPPDEWKELLLSARRNIDLLGYAMLHLPEQHPDLMAVLKAKADQGCKVRIALADPSSEEARRRDNEERLEGGLVARIRTAAHYFDELRGSNGVEIRYHRTPMYNSIFRFDDQMFVTAHLYGIPGSKAPLIHLRRRGGAGIFDNFLSHFEAVWATAENHDSK